ncbi:MAG: flippase activity-associated protein Agl23 [Halobacteriaceae archaeon]
MAPRRPPVDRRALPAILAITALALAARLWRLGWRIAHQDEGRVGDWILHYVRTGHWEYRAIIHGPFIPHVDGVLFSVFGASDFTARVVVAVVGGLLPLAAWLLRDRLTLPELVATALFLAANPVLLYYSRFMRNDVLLATFTFIAVGFAIRAIDRRRAPYLYAAAIAYGLALTTKENALVYPLAWGGALVLLVDHRLTLTDSGWRTTVRTTVVSTARRLWRWNHHIGGAALLGLATAVVFYAPKPALYEALTDPTRLPDVVGAATLGSWRKFITLWGSASLRDHSYLALAAEYWTVLWVAALPLSAFAVLGFLYDRYTGQRPRDIVAFCFYWGGASVVGYPLIMDIAAAWSNVHALVPLAVPAGVGVAAVYSRAAAAVRTTGVTPVAGLATVFGVVALAGLTLTVRGFDALVGGDPAAVTAAIALALIAVGGAAVLATGDVIPVPPTEAIVGGLLVAALLGATVQTGAVATRTVYERPQGPGNVLVQYAQPAGEMQAVLADIERIATTHDTGPDVLYYGEVQPQAGSAPEYEFYVPADHYRSMQRYGPAAIDANDGWPATANPPPGWFSRLPLAWYTSAYGADVTSTTNATSLRDGAPPVVITFATDAPGIHNTAADVAPYLQDYTRYRFQQYQYGRPIVIFVDPAA